MRDVGGGRRDEGEEGREGPLQGGGCSVDFAMPTASPHAAFDYKLQMLSALNVAAFEPYYDNLPVDPYIKGSFRRRRFSRFSGNPQNLQRLEHKYFVQSSKVNQLAGGVKRDFPELEEGLIELEEFQTLVASFIDFSKIDPMVTEMGIHQIRIVASKDEQGEPAPEGIHQDGFDYVGIFCIKRDEISGGETHLYRAKDQPPIFDKVLVPGEFVMVNDRELFHYASAVAPTGDTQGVRDVFVFTA